MSIIAIFSATFGLSIAYQVFLLARMREYVLAGDGPGPRRATACATPPRGDRNRRGDGRRDLPFLFTDLLSVRQFGIAARDGRLLDALLVRPVVLPAVIELLGRRAWWPTRAPIPCPEAPAPPTSRPPAAPRIDPTPV